MTTLQQKIETFLDTYSPHLPKQFETGVKGVVLKTHRNFWRALILTYSDRYGAGGGISTLQYPGSEVWGKTLRKLIKSVSIMHKRLRNQLALRTDTERVQIQRPLKGRSLLSITTSRSPEHSRALRALVVLGVHPINGVHGFRLPNFDSAPFMLPRPLQDKLPKLTQADNHRDVVIHAPKMTRFVENMYRARHWVHTHHPDTPNNDPFVEFLRTSRLVEEATWSTLGVLPAQFNPHTHGFVVKVPLVKPGQEIILWSTWHATAGTDRYLNDAKVTGFVDMVPKTFLSNELLEWYRYACTHAPVDPGSGSNRGAYASFMNRAAHDAMSPHGNIEYGLPDHCMAMFDSGTRSFAVDASDMRGLGTLTQKHRQQFYDEGYLIITIPQALQEQLPAEGSIRNLNSFIRNLTGDATFDLNDAHGESLSRVLDLAESEKHTGDKYSYFADRMPESDILNPFRLGKKSKMAQGGGKLITKNCGMGRGTTYIDEPLHLEFQFSSFVYNVLSSFYEPGRVAVLIPVLERFRAKTTEAWANATHVDNAAHRLVPIQYWDRMNT